MHVDIVRYTHYIDDLLLKEASAFEEKILHGRISAYDEYKYALGRIQGIHEARAVIHAQRDIALKAQGELGDD
jgi:hypothetical protein